MAKKKSAKKAKSAKPDRKEEGRADPGRVLHPDAVPRLPGRRQGD